MWTEVAEYLPSALNMISGIGVLVISFLVDARFQLDSQVAKQGGIISVVIGMLLVVWSAFHLRGAFLGAVQPKGKALVRSGPYRFVRHPVYLGMTIALAGAAISLRSWLGLLAVFCLFLPSEIYRAKLEERSLRKRHGAEWDAYARETGFLLPLF
jgi:protein-S-isoprenylcysteine O-methyltransferase Ste14